MGLWSDITSTISDYTTSPDINQNSVNVALASSDSTAQTNAIESAGDSAVAAFVVSPIDQTDDDAAAAGDAAESAGNSVLTWASNAYAAIVGDLPNPSTIEGELEKDLIILLVGVAALAIFILYIEHGPKVVPVPV